MQVRERPIPPDPGTAAHDVAGRYRLDGLLGRGGAADVFEALDLRLRRAVAVKMFRPTPARRPGEQCDQEGRLLARMQHPGLVTLYDTGRDDGRPYLVMELVRGTTLRGRIARSTLDAVETCRMGTVLASALAHVHGHGVVHRDIKPANILLDHADAPHLADFGISRRFDTPAGQAPADDGHVVGTASYMAPEQALGRPAGPAADVYSLGLVLLEALKGEPEYGGAPLEAALAHLDRPAVIPPGLPARLGELLTAMTSGAPSARPEARTCARTLALALADLGAPTRQADEARPVSPARHASTVRSAPRSTPRGRPRSGSGARPGAREHVCRPGRARAMAATLATLGLTLTGSLGKAPAGDEGLASRPTAHAATAEHLPERAAETIPHPGWPPTVR